MLVISSCTSRCCATITLVSSFDDELREAELRRAADQRRSQDHVERERQRATHAAGLLDEVLTETATWLAANAADRRMCVYTSRPRMLRSPVHEVSEDGWLLAGDWFLTSRAQLWLHGRLRCDVHSLPSGRLFCSPSQVRRLEHAKLVAKDRRRHQEIASSLGYADAVTLTGGTVDRVGLDVPIGDTTDRFFLDNANDVVRYGDSRFAPTVRSVFAGRLVEAGLR